MLIHNHIKLIIVHTYIITVYASYQNLSNVKNLELSMSNAYKYYILLTYQILKHQNYFTVKFSEKKLKKNVGIKFICTVTHID